MMPLLFPGWGRVVRALIAGSAALALAACEGSSGSARDEPPGAVVDRGPYRPAGDEGLGVSVVIVLDNSGSMRNTARGDHRPKAELAKEAIARALDATETAIAKRPDYPINVSLLLFSDGPHPILEMQPYNRDSLRAAMARLPRPSGGTGIGNAMLRAREILYRAGTFRKVMLVVTDGENTTGPVPDDIARTIYRRSEGGVGMYFVAFDTDPAKFGFLADVKGEVVAAQNGTTLATSLSALYESKVLAESATEPSAPVVSAPSKSSSRPPPHP